MRPFLGYPPTLERAFLRAPGFAQLASGTALKPPPEGSLKGWLRPLRLRHPDAYFKDYTLKVRGPAHGEHPAVWAERRIGPMSL